MSRHKDPDSIIDKHLIVSVVTDLVLCGAWSNVPHIIFKVERHVDLLTLYMLLSPNLLKIQWNEPDRLANYYDLSSQ